MTPFFIRPKVAERVDALGIDFNTFGFDRYGLSKRHLKLFFSVITYFYDYYFKVQSYGLDHVPEEGRAMLVVNHSGGVALDALLVLSSLFWSKDPPRIAQGMADKFLNQLPILSSWCNRVGQLTGLPSHARRLLEDERLLMVFPEGSRGTAKLYNERRSLVRFGHGFIRLALQTKTPIIPVAFIGAGEAIPTIYNSKALGKLFGVPYLPFTPYLLPIPRPVRCEIHYGKPLVFQGNGDEPDEVIEEYVEVVKTHIRALIDDAGAYYDERQRLELEGSPLTIEAPYEQDTNDKDINKMEEE